MSQSVFTSASPPGAGRLIDMWMDIPAMVLFSGSLGNTNPSPSSLTRIGGQVIKYPSGDAFTRVDVSNAITTAVYGGRTCMVLPDLGFNQQSYTCQYGVAPISFLATGDKVDSDSMNAWRIIFIVAAVGFESAAGADVGMFFRGFTQPGGSTITGPTGNIPGFGVAFADAFGIPYWVSRTNTTTGPPDELVPLPGAVADGDWHSYEFRITWANDSQNAAIAVLYDNVTVIQRSWGLVTTVPDYATYPGMGGLFPQIRKNGGSGIQNMYLNQFRVMSAPTFQALF